MPSLDSDALKLRSLASKDIAPLAQIIATTPLWQRHGITQEKAALRLQRGFEQNASIIVAEVDKIAVGFVWFAAQGAFNRSGYIMLIAVDENLRGQKIGQSLMEHAESALFASNDDIFLLVSDFNLAAQRFYRQRGYELIGTIPDYVTTGIAELIFRKRKP